MYCHGVDKVAIEFRLGRLWRTFHRAVLHAMHLALGLTVCSRNSLTAILLIMNIGNSLVKRGRRGWEFDTFLIHSNSSFDVPIYIANKNAAV